ncbi:MAG: SPOR domain-containing protein [Ignavibacteria bacterium]|nr:SPOR domain-containing protein [Ignavibacteria bacterium]
MTRTELVKKIIRFAGVPEQEAKIFMETLLRKLSSILSDEDVFQITGIGAFKTKNLHTDFNSMTSATPNVIIFNDDYFFGDGGTELLFGIPESKREKVSEIDALFSLSIGKPIIPLHVDDKSDLYSLYTGSEINFIIDSKVEKLINNSELIRNQFSVNMEQLISEEIPTTIDEISEPVSIPQQIDLFNESDFADGISWDFGQTWQDEFDENEILNVEESGDGVSITDFPKMDDKELDDIYSTWDFGRNKSKSFIDEEPQEPLSDEDSISDDYIEPEIDDEKTNDIENEKLTPTQEFWQSIDDDKIVEDEQNINIEDSYFDDYKPVKSRTQELNIDLSGIDLSEYENPPHVYDEEDDAWKRLTNEIEDDSFVEVTKGDENKFKIDDFYYNPERTAEEEEIAAILEAHKNEEKNAASRFEVYSSSEKFDQQQNIESPYEIKASPYKNDEFDTAKPLFVSSEDNVESTSTSVPIDSPIKKRKTTRAFLNVLLLLGIIVISGYLYSKFYGIPKWTGLQKEIFIKVEKPISNPVIIERDYNIPVNYPYLKQNMAGEDFNHDLQIPEKSTQSVLGAEEKTQTQVELEPNELFSKQNPGNILSKKANDKLPEQKTNDVSVKEKTELTAKTQTIGTEKKVSENIFQDGNYYSVQVSSWKAKSKAQSEVARYLKLGRQALLVEAQIPGRGIWYRVRITGFNSISEAEKFLTQNR